MATKLSVKDVKEKCDCVLSKMSSYMDTSIIGGVAFPIMSYIEISTICGDITTEESHALIKEFAEKICLSSPSEKPLQYKKRESKAWVPTSESNHSYETLVSLGRKEEADRLYPERSKAQDLGRK